jgi:Fe2+ transport system protein FeoA
MHDCDKAGGKNSSRQGKPLASTGRCEKVRICKINGDRKMCARMAQLGFLPGSEIELICPGRSDKPCMVRVKGATVTLDELQARQILVTPA